MPLTKSPHPERLGPETWADWYRGCVMAVAIQKEREARGEESEILILTAVRYKNAQDEWFSYSWALRQLGASNIRVVRECHETVEQIEAAVARAKAADSELIVIATWTHYIRTALLLRGSGARLLAAFGIPNAWYTIADVFLIPGQILMDVTGTRARWVEFTKRRRLKHKY